MGGRAWTSQVSRCKLTEPGRARGPRVAARRPVASLRPSSVAPPAGGRGRGGDRRATRVAARRDENALPIEHTRRRGCGMCVPGPPAIADTRPAGVPAARRAAPTTCRRWMCVIRPGPGGAVSLSPEEQGRERTKTDGAGSGTRTIHPTLPRGATPLPLARESLCSQSRFGARNVRCADPPP